MTYNDYVDNDDVDRRRHAPVSDDKLGSLMAILESCAVRSSRQAKAANRERRS